MNHITTPPMGNISLPRALVLQWMEANDENTPTAWACVVGMVFGILIYRHDIAEELTFLFSIAMRRGLMAQAINNPLPT